MTHRAVYVLGARDGSDESVTWNRRLRSRRAPGIRRLREPIADIGAFDEHPSARAVGVHGPQRLILREEDPSPSGENAMSPIISGALLTVVAVPVLVSTSLRSDACGPSSDNSRPTT